MEIIHFTPPNQLIEQVRNTTMLTDKSIYPYQHADIRVEDMPIEEFLPTQLYVLKEHLEIQSELRESLLEKGHDTLRLFGSVLLRSAGIVTGMMPPIVEDDCEFGPCLLDGTHRAYLARQLGMKSLGVLHVRGVLKSTPMIPLPNQWSEIIEYETIPTDKSKKKRYRNLPDKYSYYRDFSEITGIGKDPRSEMIMEVQNA
ncbi:MAG TPA: hypothetical protein VMR16_00100 [Candidatus Saccharimonadales bacterium]|nr:hypothetical protein [Candidatus Saccharimonadales bacterium]